jgi:hypothetical protein
MVVAAAALVISASGTAVAASGLVSGDSVIAKNSLSGDRLRNHTITGTQVNLKRLGKVPSAKNADRSGTAILASSASTAGSATNATNAVNATNALNATNATNATTATNATNASNLGGQPPSAFDPAANWFRSGLVTASGGQSVPFMSLPPFTLMLKCTNNGGGSFTAEIEVTSTEANSEVFGTLVPTAGTNQPILNTGANATFAESNNNVVDLIGGVSHKAYQGAMLSGVKGFGSNCFANAVMGVS